MRVRDESAEPIEWRPLSVPELVAAMRGVPCPWWVAGGWAIDLWLGRTTRAHEDTDVVILTRDQLTVQRHLRGWRLFKTKQATPTKLALWPEDEFLPPESGVNDVWANAEPGGPWRFQLMFTETQGDRWVFRRARDVGGGLVDLGWRHADGFDVLRPEVQLLYKARPEGRRAKDDVDFAAVVGSLPREAKSWLAKAIHLAYGADHDWVDRLRG